MAAGFPQIEWIIQGSAFYDLVSNVTHHCFYFFLFVQSKSVSPAHAQERRIRLCLLKGRVSRICGHTLKPSPACFAWFSTSYGWRFYTLLVKSMNFETWLGLVLVFYRLHIVWFSGVLTFSAPQFPPLYNEENNSIYLIGVCE